MGHVDGGEGAAVRQVAGHALHAEYMCDRVRLWLDWTASGAVLTTVAGSGVAALAQPILDNWERVRKQDQPLRLLLDFARMPVYDGAFRRRLTRWLEQWRSQLVYVEVLSGSKLVTMGASLTNLALGGDMVRTHTQPSAFEAEVRAAGLTPRAR